MTADARSFDLSSIDWVQVSEETVGHLQRMIQIDTVNPPGNELAVAQYLEGVLKAEGIGTRLFEPVPGRAAFV
jgi:acetylornithine deacetylase/succinyl-diaminopimelate desuccinylase-like protein